MARKARFSAPLSFIRLVGGGSGAVPVVDLGTAARVLDWGVNVVMP
jgi:hypothetical protein